MGPLSFISHSYGDTCTPQGHVGFHASSQRHLYIIFPFSLEWNLRYSTVEMILPIIDQWFSFFFWFPIMVNTLGLNSLPYQPFITVDDLSIVDTPLLGCLYVLDMPSFDDSLLHRRAICLYPLYQWLWFILSTHIEKTPQTLDQWSIFTPQAWSTVVEYHF